MSAAAAATASADAPPPARGKKKLMIIGLVATLVLAGGGAGGWFWWQQKKAAEADEEPVVQAHHPVGPPTYMPLETMVVNLADPGGERMIQLGIQVQLDDAKAADLIKGFLPSIRSNILMQVSQRTSAELLTREGKERLAADIAREIALPLDVDMGDDEHAAGAHDAKPAKAGKGEKTGKGKKRKPAKPHNPVQEVHFSSFIIQ